MTKKDYGEIAAVLKLCSKVADPWDQLPQAVYALANLFQVGNNPLFNQREFLDAAGLPR